VRLDLTKHNRNMEKWNSSKIGDKRGSSKWRHGAGGQGLHDSKGVCTRAAAQDAASSIQDQVAGMPAAAQAALSLDTSDGGVL
jgi:hypothetical protein